MLTLLPLEETDRPQHLLHHWSIVQQHWGREHCMSVEKRDPSPPQYKICLPTAAVLPLPSLLWPEEAFALLFIPFTSHCHSKGSKVYKDDLQTWITFHWQISLLCFLGICFKWQRQDRLKIWNNVEDKSLGFFWVPSSVFHSLLDKTALNRRLHCIHCTSPTSYIRNIMKNSGKLGM